MSFLKTLFYFWNFYLVLFYAFHFSVLLSLYYYKHIFIYLLICLATLIFSCVNSKCIGLLYICFFSFVEAYILLIPRISYTFGSYHEFVTYIVKALNLVLLLQKMFLLLLLLWLLLFFCSFHFLELQLQTLSFQQQLKLQFSYFSFSWTFWDLIYK